MNVRLMMLVLLSLLPTMTLAAPPEGEYYRYWSEPDSLAYVSAEVGSYEVSGRFVAVLTYEENPRTGRYAMIGELFDCRNSLVALAERIEFDASNVEAAKYSNDNVKKSFAAVEEDTRQEFLLIGVCSEETRLPYDREAMRRYFKMIDESLRTVERN